jgi:ribulose 1,5-bisphosphate synthetase/thiazole synthase
MDSGPGKVVCHNPKDREDILLKVLKEGFPVNPNECQGHVVIVGAGIAGLTAGKLLKEAGIRVLKSIIFKTEKLSKPVIEVLA